MDELQQPGTVNQTYIGTKLIQAWPMTRAAYDEYRGWNPPEGEDQAVDGYLVEYIDGGKSCDSRHAGYISWSPKEQFDNAYRPCSAMTFGLAIEALKRGDRVARTGWNGAGMWIALGSERHDLPAADFWNRHSRAHAEANGGTCTVQSYIIMKTAQGDIQMGWSPTQPDCLAEDWAIV